MDAALRHRGFRVGRFTSPHLVDFRERIVVDGAPIPEPAVLEFLSRWEKPFSGAGATFFEITTALAFDWFARERVDYAVIETGLGGRLDSTNVVTPLAATVVSVGLDHTDLLGDTLPAIAAEKAGIFKPGVPAVIGERAGDIAMVLEREALARGAEPRVVSRSVSVAGVDVTRSGTRFRISTGAESADVHTPLAGAHQAWNTAVAWASLSAGGSETQFALGELTDALSRLWLAGRFQRREHIIFDVAHNPAGARVVADTLRGSSPTRQVTALLAVMADKDWRGIIDELAPAIDRFFFTTAPGAPEGRAWDPRVAYDYALGRGYAADLDASFDDALARAQKRCGTLLITGSFHTVGAAMERLQVSPFSP